VRKVFLHIIVSLDGLIEGPNRELDWQFDDDEFDSYINEVLSSIDGMFFGRVAYELLADYWPDAAASAAASGLDPSRMPKHMEAARMMNALPKYVVSTTPEKTGWNNSHLIRDRVAERVLELKRQPGKDLALFAGAELASSFMRLRLLDEVRLVVNPVVLGAGKPLFKTPSERLAMQLSGTRTFRSGAVVLSYRPDEVRTA
jgi:dihydrofolate reductase